MIHQSLCVTSHVKMSFKMLSFLLLLQSVVIVHGHGRFRVLIDKVNRIDNELFELQMGLPRLKEEFQNDLDKATLALRSDLLNSIGSEYMETQMKNYIVKTLRTEYFEEMLNNQMAVVLRRLKQELQLLKRRHRLMSQRLTVLEKEKSINSDNMAKRNEEFVQLAARVELLERKPAGKEQLTDIESKNITLRNSAEEMNNRRSCPNKDRCCLEPPKHQNVTKEKKYRLLLAPLSSFNKRYLQLSIHTSNLTDYIYLNMSDINSVGYNPKSREILLAVHEEKGIYSTCLDTREITLLKNGVQSHGLVVDATKQILFMTTVIPRHTVSQMTTSGENFTTVVDLTEYGRTPLGITVDPKHETIYACLTDRVISVNYDGTNVHTLYNGWHTYSVDIDLTNNLLFFNERTVIMSLSLENRSVTQVLEVDYTPISLQYHNKTLYMSNNRVDAISFQGSPRLMKMKSLDSSYFMCLLPD